MPPQDAVHLERRIGEDIAPLVPEIAALRAAILREWPYLYAEDRAFQRDAMSASIGSPRALALLALFGSRLVGVSTGVPMADEVEELRLPLAEAGMDPREAFYFGESALLPEFRNRGIGAAFFREREEHAASLGYRWAVFCAVERSPADPRCPGGWIPLDGFWRRMGFAPSDITTSLSWKEVGEGVETPKPVRFWLKTMGVRP
ncbi:MAG: GNAT family N-acetyltransferase [Magnetospirillum sp.]|nr:GNAT family N-acetyltransferase [Magnetospirillum sp.]